MSSRNTHDTQDAEVATAAETAIADTENAVDWDKYLRTYYEKPSSARTWSGFEVKEAYDPSDRAEADYQRDLGDPGSYPFTRGIHRDMFRGRY